MGMAKVIGHPVHRPAKFSHRSNLGNISMAVSSEQLIAFVAVAKYGSIAEAARQLNKSRPTVSERISNLEIDLGFDLLDRSRRDVVLTEEGLSLLTQAKVAVLHLERFSQLSENTMVATENHVVLCFDGHIPSEPMAQLVLQLKNEFPNTQIDLLKDYGESVKDNLSLNADIIFCLNDASQTYGDCDFQQVANMRLSYVARQNHPLCGKVHSLEDMSCYPQLALGASYSQAFMDMALISPNWSTVSDIDAMKILLAKSDSWTILPAFISAPLIDSGLLAEINVDFIASDHSIPVDMVWRDQAKLGPVKARCITLASTILTAI